MANWIWNSAKYLEDSYVEFTFEVEYQAAEVEMLIGAVNNYTLYVNNLFIDCSSYHSYPYAPVLDRLSIKLKKGLNKFKIIAYSYDSTGCMFFYKDVPGIYFILKDGEKVLKESNEDILSALSNQYLSEKRIQIDGQLGFKQFIDLTKSEPVFHKSVIMDKPMNFTLRPNKKCLLLGRLDAIIIKETDDFILVDTGKEHAGFLDFDIDSSNEQDVIISFGEHIADGQVRRLIHGRDFSFEVRLKKGNNQFLSTLKRIGARYIQINYIQPIKVNYLGIFEVEYPFIIKPREFSDELDQKIYDTSIHTLKCCYHEHFEDCPWREQSLYTLDSRLQMLAYYQAFKNDEAVDASIDLMLNDWRKDGQLNICFPTNASLVIPSYSLYFFDIIWENYEHTKNIEILQKSTAKLDEILNSFENNMENGLVNRFDKEDYWNFYEWIWGYEGYTPVDAKTDAVINLLYLNSLIIKNKINSVLKIDKDYSLEISILKQRIKDEFYDEKRMMIDFYKGGLKYSSFINSLAISLDVVPNVKETAKHMINDKDVAQPTLSMKYFLYDALLKTDSSYKTFVLDDIRKTYKTMLEDGATSFYETILGEKDFGNAGSLCHGWSGAVPIIFYNRMDVK